MGVFQGGVSGYRLHRCTEALLVESYVIPPTKRGNLTDVSIIQLVAIADQGEQRFVGVFMS